MSYVQVGKEGEWRKRAKCRNMDPEIFFLTWASTDSQVKAAKEVCDGCPVRHECLEAGLRERFGIWGGMTERARRRIRRTRGIPVNA